MFVDLKMAVYGLKIMFFKLKISILIQKITQIIKKLVLSSPKITQIIKIPSFQPKNYHFNSKLPTFR
jgi:hypothetical protein